MARFLQLSDLHVVAEGELAAGVLDTRSILSAAIDQLIEMRAMLDPLDAVLVSGDISDAGKAESYGFARAELERLGLPLWVVPGNHDAREPLRAAFSGLATMPSTGQIDWSAQVGDTLVIGLDTLVEGRGAGALQDDSLAFLRDALSASRSGSEARAAIVLLHHPPIQTGIRFMDKIGLENAEGLNSVLSDVQSDVLLLAGHVHGVHHGRLGRHPVATAPSVCSMFALDRRMDAKAGFLNGPTGCTVIDTGPSGILSFVPLVPGDGPFPFQ